MENRLLSTPVLSTTMLRLPAVKAKTGLSRSTIYQRIANNEFPPPVPLGPQSVGWIEAEVERWLQDRIQQARRTAG